MLIGHANLGNEISHKTGRRVGLQKIAFPGQGVLIGRSREKIKTEFAGAEVLPESPVAVFSSAKADTEWRLRMFRFRQGDGDHHAPAETYIDEKSLFGIGGVNEQAEVIGLRNVTTIRTHHGGSYSRYLEADLRQRPAEQPVLFIAPATAILMDDFIVCGCRIRLK